MQFVSTGGYATQATLEEALFKGLAPDGGLYMPRSLPSFSHDDLMTLGKGDWPGTASTVAARLLSDSMDRKALESVVSRALDFPVPLVQLKDRIFVMELFRGPTLAFKDVGARFMAHLVAHFRKVSDPPLTVLTATSGDTGGAVAHAFLGLPGIRVVVLFPDGKVTPRQERQFSTLGENVRALAVRGDFDDCQRLVKGAFGDRELRDRTALTSANSINVGRLLPQAFYYFQAWAELTGGGTPAPGEPPLPVLFSVPSGNLGNLAAGLLAKSMGLPNARFLAATNANDGIGELLREDRFVPRASLRTVSTAMDVGNPSNLARILHLYGGDLGRLRDDLSSMSVSDPETLACIRKTHRETGYILDPHSAVGLAALEAELDIRPDAVGVLLATAHPAKFAEVVEPILGQTLPIPPELAVCLEGKREITPLEPKLEALREILLGGD